MFGINIDLTGHIFESEEDQRIYHNKLWYYKLYCKIIEKNIPLGLDKKKVPYYTEKHHILPKCMGGTNDKSNLVLLSAREHILVHALLAKIYSDCIELNQAVTAMCIFTTSMRGKAINNLSIKTISYFREQAATLRRGKYRFDLTKEGRDKLKQANGPSKLRGTKLSEDHKKKVSEGVKRHLSTLTEEERKQKYSNKPEYVEWRRKRREEKEHERQEAFKEYNDKKNKLILLKQQEKERKQKELEIARSLRPPRHKTTKPKLVEYFKTHLQHNVRSVIDDVGNEFNSVKACADFYNLSSASILNRIKKGIFKYKE